MQSRAASLSSKKGDYHEHHKSIGNRRALRLPDKRRGQSGGTTVTRVDAQGRATTVANGLRTPVGLARMPDGRLMVGSWGDNAAFVLNRN